MSAVRAKFSTQVDPVLLDGLCALAKSERRQLQALVDEGFADLLEKYRKAKARPHLIAAYQASHAVFGPLYEKLAK